MAIFAVHLFGELKADYTKGNFEARGCLSHTKDLTTTSLSIFIYRQQFININGISLVLLNLQYANIKTKRDLYRIHLDLFSYYFI